MSIRFVGDWREAAGRHPPEPKSADREAQPPVGGAGVQEPLLTLTEAAKIVGLPARVLAKYAHRGELVGRRIGRRWTFTQAAVDAFLEVMGEWVVCQPRGMNGDGAESPTQEEVAELLRQMPKPIPPKAQQAVDKLREYSRRKAAQKPHNPLEPDPSPTKPAAERDRDPRGRFEGPRRDVEGVPRLPTFPARWVLEDPRRRPYLVFWTDGGGATYALKMAAADDGDAVLVTLENSGPHRIAVLRRPLPRGTGTALFYRCPWCQKPRWYLYLLTRSGDKLVDYLGLRCQVGAGLRFASQGRYVRSFSRAVLKPFLSGRRAVRPILRRPWDPHAVSVPSLGSDDLVGARHFVARSARVSLSWRSGSRA